MQGLFKMIVGPSCCRNSCVFLWKLRKLETGIKLFGKWSTIWTLEMVHHCTCLVFPSSDHQAQIHPIVNDERRKLWLMFTHLLPFVKLSLHTYQNYWQTHRGAYLWRICDTCICASTTTNLAGIMHWWFFRFFNQNPRKRLVHIWPYARFYQPHLTLKNILTLCSIWSLAFHCLQYFQYDDVKYQKPSQVLAFAVKNDKLICFDISWWDVHKWRTGACWDALLMTASPW